MNKKNLFFMVFVGLGLFGCATFDDPSFKKSSVKRSTFESSIQFTYPRDKIYSYATRIMRDHFAKVTEVKYPEELTAVIPPGYVSEGFGLIPGSTVEGEPGGEVEIKFDENQGNAIATVKVIKTEYYKIVEENTPISGYNASLQRIYKKKIEGGKENDFLNSVLDTLNLVKNEIELDEAAEKKDIAKITEFLSSEKKEVKIKAVNVLGKMKDKYAASQLIGLLEDEDYDVRQKVAEALVKISILAVEPLITALKDKDFRVHWNAAELLVKIGISAVEPLIAALKDKDVNVRKEAAEALGKIGDKRAVVPLIAALKDYARRPAAEALGKIGDARALAALKNVKDPNFYTMEAVKEAIRKIEEKKQK